MRRAALVILILAPSFATAQIRLPLPGRRIPAELPPQAPGIARDVEYQRMRYSVSSYTLVSRIVSPGFTGGRVGSWSSLGAGTQASYRIIPNLAATMDVTSSFLGGPATMETAELGTRLGADSSHRVRPFADARVGYAYALNGLYDLALNAAPDGSAYNSRFSHGAGAIVGAGLDVRLTQTLSITAAAQTGHFRMTAYAFGGGAQANPAFSMTMYRLALGLVWNPMHLAPALRQKQNQ